MLPTFFYAFYNPESFITDKNITRTVYDFVKFVIKPFYNPKF